MAALACLSDLIASVHIRTVVSGRLPLAVGSVVLLGYTQFAFNFWFVESCSLIRRLWLTTAAAAGAGAGTLIVLSCL